MGRGRTRDIPSNDAAPSFGACLRSLREATGLTQEELALRSGLSSSAVGALERGTRRRPYPHTVRSIADALGLSEGDRAALLASVPKRGGAASSAGDTSPADALPHPATRLVGRERQLEEVRGLLARPDVRLLTLTGIGGVGKTRLAVEIARGAAEDFPDGAAFVGLAPLAGPSLVVPTVLGALGVPETQGRIPSEALVGHLRDKGLLLVLDNFEHLLEAAPEVAALIETCPGVVVLATSRAPLRVRGEREYPVPPLALPPSARSPSEEEVLASSSGRLFVERAQASSPNFEVTAENAGPVGAICRRLAGLPLALELAAAKARLLDPAALLSRLDEALSTAWARDLPERQRTMRAALDWSHDLLSEPERALLRRLSVFAGGFTLSAAEAVGIAEGGGEVVLGLLGVLVEQSLVVTEPSPGDGVTRYGMLEPVRQYAGENLEESAEEDEVRRRHAEWYLALAEEAEPELGGPDRAWWLARLETEHDNLRAALGWTLGGGGAELGLGLAGALWSFWYTRGHLSEGRRWLESAVLENGPSRTGAKAKALNGAGYIALFQGQYRAAKGFLEEGLALYRQLEDKEGVASALIYLGFVAVLGERDLETVPALYAEAVSLGPEIEDRRVMANLLLFRGLVTVSQGGDHERATALHEEALAMFRQMRDVQGMGHCLNNLALGAVLRADYDDASALLRENLGIARKARYMQAIQLSLLGMGYVAVGREEPARAARLRGAVQAMEEAFDIRISSLARSITGYEGYLAAARSRLDEEAFAAAWAEGRAMTTEQAVEYALEGR